MKIKPCRASHPKARAINERAITKHVEVMESRRGERKFNFTKEALICNRIAQLLRQGAR